MIRDLREVIEQFNKLLPEPLHIKEGESFQFNQLTTKQGNRYTLTKENGFIFEWDEPRKDKSQ